MKFSLFAKVLERFSDKPTHVQLPLNKKLLFSCVYILVKQNTMTLRVTRGQKRRIKEKLTDLNMYTEDLTFSEMAELDKILLSPEKIVERNSNPIRCRKRKAASNSADQSWDGAVVISIEFQQNNNDSPESSPTYHRKLFVTALVHHGQDDSPNKNVSRPLSPRIRSSSSSDTEVLQTRMPHSRRLIPPLNLDSFDAILPLTPPQEE